MCDPGFKDLDLHMLMLVVHIITVWCLRSIKLPKYFLVSGLHSVFVKRKKKQQQFKLHSPFSIVGGQGGSDRLGNGMSLAIYSLIDCLCVSLE